MLTLVHYLPQAMLAGAVAFLHKKRGGTCWVSLGPGKTHTQPQGYASPPAPSYTSWVILNLQGLPLFLPLSRPC